MECRYVVIRKGHEEGDGLIIEKQGLITIFNIKKSKHIGDISKIIGDSLVYCMLLASNIGFVRRAELGELLNKAKIIIIPGDSPGNVPEEHQSKTFEIKTYPPIGDIIPGRMYKCDALDKPYSDNVSFSWVMPDWACDYEYHTLSISGLLPVDKFIAIKAKRMCFFIDGEFGKKWYEALDGSPVEFLYLISCDVIEFAQPPYEVKSNLVAYYHCRREGRYQKVVEIPVLDTICRANHNRRFAVTKSARQ